MYIIDIRWLGWLLLSQTTWRPKALASQRPRAQVAGAQTVTAKRHKLNCTPDIMKQWHNQK